MLMYIVDEEAIRLPQYSVKQTDRGVAFRSRHGLFLFVKSANKNYKKLSN
jgi:hypothetical protein